MARFVWSAVRAVTGSSWNPSGFSEFYWLVSSTNGRDRRIVTRNKALIEGQLIRHPVDLLYKRVSFLQLWKLLARIKDRLHVEQLISRLRAQRFDVWQSTTVVPMLSALRRLAWPLWSCSEPLSFLLVLVCICEDILDSLRVELVRVSV